MPFLKLDTGILNSTIWSDRDGRDVFLTALLMAVPREIKTALPQLDIRSLAETGWTVPPGWYGWVAAAGVGIVTNAQVEREAGLLALERLGAPEPDSRSRAFDGRRLVRVDGGFVVLNFMAYREKDHTTADRSRRYRQRHGVSQRENGVTPRVVTHADADADADPDPPVGPPQGDAEPKAAAEPLKARKSKRRASERPADWKPTKAHQDYATKHGLDVGHEALAFRAHHDSKGSLFVSWDAAFTKWLTNEVRWNKQRGGGRNGAPVVQRGGVFREQDSSWLNETK
jgi:hypothetical protein